MSAHRGPTRLISLRCPHCGAALPPREESGVYRCEFCESTFEAQHAQAMAPVPQPMPPPQPFPVYPYVPYTPSRVDVQPRSNAGATAAMVIGIVVALSFVGGIVGFFATVTPNRRTSTPATPKTAEEPFNGVSTRFMYDNGGGKPLPVRHGEDEWFLARFQVADQDMWISVIDTETMKEKYRLGSFGAYSAGYGATYYAAAGGKIFVSDLKAIVHVYDLNKGKPQGTFKLTDRANRLCASPKDDAIWIDVADEKTVMVDVATLASKPAPRPTWCANDDSGMPSSWWSVAGKFKGFSANHYYSDGVDGAAAGSKSPGTAFPMAVGFDPMKKTARWSLLMPSKDADTVPGRGVDKAALGFGMFAAVYQQTDQQYNLTLLDAKTGDRKWDVALPNPAVGGGDVDAVLVTQKYVYLPRGYGVETYRASNGKRIGRIGEF